MAAAVAAKVSGHLDAGLAVGQGAGGWQRPGRGWSVPCVTGARLAAGAQDRVQVCMGGAGLAGEGGGRLRARPGGGGGGSGNLERYSWNKGKHYAGGDASAGEIAATRR